MNRFLLRRHAGGSSPAWMRACGMQMAEPRLPAADRSGTSRGRRRGRSIKWMPALGCGIKLSFPLARECIINHPVRWPGGRQAGGFRPPPGGYGHPRRSVPDAALPPTSCRRALLPHTGLLSINDGGVTVRHLSGMAKGLAGWQLTCSLFVVIPAKARLQDVGGRCALSTGLCWPGCNAHNFRTTFNFH